MDVHASVYEGCSQTNIKTFLRIDMDMLEQVLKRVQQSYRTKMVIVDGVYSQEGLEVSITSTFVFHHGDVCDLRHHKGDRPYRR